MPRKNGLEILLREVEGLFSYDQLDIEYKASLNNCHTKRTTK